MDRVLSVARRMLRGDEGRFIVVHGSNSLLGFALTFVQFFVFVRILDAGFFAQIILLTTAAVFVMPVDEAVSRVAYVLLSRAKCESERDEAWRSLAGLYLGYGAVCVALLAAIAALLELTTGSAAQIVYFATCLATNTWLYHGQAIGWARQRAMGFEALEFMRKTLQVALLGVLYATGDFAAYVTCLALSWPVFYALYLRYQSGSFRPTLPHGVALGSLGPCLVELRAAFGGSLGQFALMNVPYLWASLLFGVGAPIIVLDVVLKIMRAALHAFHLSSESFLQRLTTCFHAGDRAGVVRALLYSLLLAAVPGALLLATLLLGDGILFRALLGAKIGMLPAGVTPLLVAFIGAALVLNAATSFLGFLGFFREMFRIGLAGFAGLLVLGAIAWAAGLSLLAFLWLYFAVYAGVTVLAGWAVVAVVGRLPERTPSAAVPSAIG